MLHSNTTLRVLDIKQHGIGHEGGLALAEAVRVNRTVEVLDVSQGLFVWGHAAPAIAQAAAHRPSLRLTI